MSTSKKQVHRNGSTPEEETVRIGLLGCGARLRHVTARLLEAPGAERLRIAGFYDTDPLALEAARKELPMEETRIHDSYQSLVADPNIDWVMIGSWNCFHREHAIAALEAGKNVFCEKPLATSLEDCLAIREAVQRTGRVFSFGLVLRYSPHHRMVKAALESGAVGRIISFEFNETIYYYHGALIHGNWRRLERNAGSHILEKCCHDMDLAIWLTQSLPVRVASFGGNDFFRPSESGAAKALPRAENGAEAYSQWAYQDFHPEDPFTADKDIVDNQVVILEYANGARATFQTNVNAAITERRFYILGSRGTLRADSASGVIETRRIGPDAPLDSRQSGYGGGHNGGDEVMVARLAETMISGAPPLAGVEDGIRSAIACFGIDEALRTGRVVELGPLWKRAGIVPEGFGKPGERGVPALAVAT
jgi:predicted dehydrogenase